MKNYFRRVGLLMAVCLGSCLVAAAPKWQRLEADEFTIYSDASTKDIKEFAVNYTAFRQVINELFMSAGHKPTSSTLILFKKGSSVKKYGPINREDDLELQTFTAQVDGSPLLALAISGDRDRACEMVFEFETVFALDRAGYFLPTWMTQGTGMVLSTLEVGKDKCSFGGDIDGYSELFLNQGKRLPWEQFFLTGRGSAEYNGKKQAGVFQAQAWALMHWILLSERQPREQFAKLSAAIRKSSYLEAVETTMGVKAEKFSTSIAGDVGRSMRRFELPFDAEKVRAGMQLSPAPEAEIHVQLANVLAAAGRYDDSDKELSQAMALAPDAVWVKEAAARQASRNGEKDAAVKLYREAIAVGTKNAVAYLVSAGMRLDEYSLGRTDFAGGGGASTDIAIKEIKQALELAPGNIEAYRLLGRAFYILPKFTEDRLIDLNPAMVSGADGCVVRFYRALLYQRLGKLPQCVNDLQTIINDPDALQRTKQGAQERLAAVEKKK